MNTSILVDTCVGSPPEDYIASEKYRVEDREYYLFEKSLFYVISYENAVNRGATNFQASMVDITDEMLYHIIAAVRKRKKEIYYDAWKSYT